MTSNPPIAPEPDFDLPAEETENKSSESPSDDNHSPPAKSHGELPRLSPQSAIVAAAMAAATTPAFHRLLRRNEALAVVVSVPTAAWVKPVESYFKNAFGRTWKTFARDGSTRSRDKPSTGNDEVAAALAAGRSVVGVAAAPEQILPSALMAAADFRLNLPSPGGKVIRKALRTCFGPTSRKIADGDLAGLDLDDIVAAMRRTSSASDAIGRMIAASKSRLGRASQERLPELASAFEFGKAREWGLELARDLADYRAGRLAWSAIDRGAVFHSAAPGTGKSLLARSLARACCVPLVTGSIGDLFASSSGNLDGVIKAQRDLFARAQALAPSILFLDEIDSLPDRESLDSRNREWWIPVIEDFMLLLDNATGGREGVVVIGATNRIEGVDRAIMRPGRLERAIEIEPPGPDGILNILTYHVAGDLPSAELGRIAGLLEGYTAAEIMETVRSARRAARRGGRGLSVADLTASALPAVDLAPDTMFRMCVHEAGHAIVAIAIPIGRVGYIRMRARGSSGAHTKIVFDDCDLLTRAAIEHRVTALLGGRAAERVFTGVESTGAGGTDGSDLGMATRLLAALHVSDGLGERLVFLANAADAHRQLRYDPDLRRLIDAHLRELQDRALDIVRGNRAAVLAVAEELVVKRYLTGAEVTTLAAHASRQPNARASAGPSPIGRKPRNP